MNSVAAENNDAPHRGSTYKMPVMTRRSARVSYQYADCTRAAATIPVRTSPNTSIEGRQLVRQADALRASAADFSLSHAQLRATLVASSAALRPRASLAASSCAPENA